MKLSIIIPIYNVEKVLSDCLNSILSQDVSSDDIEIICVVDGSPDNSVGVVREYEGKCPNIVLVNQENKGVSAARNNALKIAKGDYVMFVDPDDVVVDGSLSKIICLLDKYEEDSIIVCRAYNHGDEEYKWIDSFEPYKSYEIKTVLAKGFLKGSVWGAIYKRSFLSNYSIEFPIGVRNCEDTYFFLLCMYYCDEIRFCDVDLYDVVGQEGSASRSFDERRLGIMVESIKQITDRIDHLPVIKSKRYVLQYMKYSLLSNFINYTIRTKDVGYSFIRNAHLQKYARFTIDENVLFYRNKIRLMRFSVPLFYFMALVNYQINNR